ncbi:hypothetical protein C8R45DRAFT_1065259 [Mycena sanguinolenta]|nr:hypothetical protein C8R45DRAFT_1065259 [Mycena sanguinolenta]
MGAILARMFPPKFRPERDIPDLSGKVIIVTGGNTGIGYHTVKQLLLKNAKVYLAARSPEKAAAAIKDLEEETKKSAIFLHLDLADLPTVRKAAETFLSQENKLDILFNNGGVMMCPDMLTAQNHDLQFGTNVIGHFFLTELLLPALTQSYNETQVPARVIHTTSAGHVFSPGNGIDFVSLKGGPERDAWVKSRTLGFMTPSVLYGESKLGNIFVSNYFAKTHSDVLVSCAVHPGPIHTELMRHQASLIRTIWNPLAFPAPLGAYAQLWAATVATPAQITGQYVVPWGKVGKPDKRASNTKLEDEVVAYAKDQVKGF